MGESGLRWTPTAFEFMDKPLSQQGRAAKIGYIPSLDGWRAIAVLGVMIAHDLPVTIFGHTSAGYQELGGRGVIIFFAISGFLITTRILEEERLCGYFDIRRFYIRRFFRIQPAAFAYLGVLGLLLIFHVYHDAWYFWFAALFFFINYTYHESASTHPYSMGHYWSLAVEEHFYLLLSLVLLLFKRNRIVVLGLLYFIFWLPFQLHYPPQAWYRPDVSPRETQWNLRYLLLAALAAVVLQRPAALNLVKRFLRPWVVLLTTVVSIPLHHFIFHEGWNGATWFVAAYLSTFWIVSTAFHPASLMTRFLETAPMRFVGRISYSLYLWHLLFFSKVSPAIGMTNPVLLALSGRVTKYVAAFAVATLSYYFIEKPLIRIGHRLAPAASPGRPELADLPVETPKPGESTARV
jgi:peptidoglycan/LPS O-acetylase OafA/YrhL